VKKVFRTQEGKEIPLPVFFPDATQAVVRTLDASDIENTGTPGVLVNTYHLWRNLGGAVLKTHGGVKEFMGWKGAVISDSGGFQVMSLAKQQSKRGAVTDEGVFFRPTGSKKIMFTPEDSIAFQMKLKPDMLVVLDDFTTPGATRNEASETVERTIKWADKCKQIFARECEKRKLDDTKRPHLLAVVQGGEYMDLRRECARELVKIGFDGLGYGGWPIRDDGSFDYEAAKVIAEEAPENYLLYGLGIGKPHEVKECVRLGYQIFDCVLPTRDARHKRLYVYNARKIEEIDLSAEKFYSYYVPDKEKYYKDRNPVSSACDCLLCTRYTRAYLAHLFRIKDATAMRLATIHNLRFYAILMEKLREG